MNPIERAEAEVQTQRNILWGQRDALKRARGPRDEQFWRDAIARADPRRAVMAKSAGYIVTDNEAIHGLGATEDYAWANMLANLAPHTSVLADGVDTADRSDNWVRESDLKIRSASAALLADVEARGGAIAWVVVGGVACTPAEAEG